MTYVEEEVNATEMKNNWVCNVKKITLFKISYFGGGTQEEWKDQKESLLLTNFHSTARSWIMWTASHSLIAVIQMEGHPQCTDICHRISLRQFITFSLPAENLLVKLLITKWKQLSFAYRTLSHSFCPKFPL